MFDIIIQNLEKWSQEHNLIENTFKSCIVHLHNAATEDAELFGTSIDMISGWKLSDIKLELENQSLIITQIGLYIEEPESCYFRGLKPIGTYQLIVTLDGEVDDTYLIIDDKSE
jgi:hypothetical protein